MSEGSASSVKRSTTPLTEGPPEIAMGEGDGSDCTLELDFLLKRGVPGVREGPASLRTSRIN